MNYKISIYAICKNEEQNVLPWLENVKEADHIVVLDTGSTDNTIKLFREAKKTYPQLIFKTKKYNNFKFDKARNDNLAMVPEDTDIYMTTDLDERITSGWYQELQEKWEENPVRCEYFFVMQHLENGDIGKEYKKNKIHAKGWHWDLPVHEVLKQDGTNEEFPKDVKFTMLKLKVHHWQDVKKDRSYYNTLIREMAENPDTNLKKLYLAIVNFNENQLEDAEIGFKELINCKEVNTVIKAYSYNIIAKIYIKRNQNDEAEKYFIKGIDIDNAFRENYIDYCQLILKNKNQHELILALCKQALKYGKKRNVFVERSEVWGYYIYETMMFSYYALKDWKNALLCAQMVLKFMPTSEGMKNNIPKILAQLSDKDFI